MTKWKFCPDRFRIGFLIGIAPTLILNAVSFIPVVASLLLLVPPAFHGDDVSRRYARSRSRSRSSNRLSKP